MKLTDLDPMPKSRPIIFGAHGVNAILDHRKTQTRRVIKGEPWGYEPSLNPDGLWEFCDDIDPDDEHHVFKCPFGKIGDLLYVKETFFVYNDWHKIYRADSDSKKPMAGACWKSPRYMPKKYSRITLEITDIRVERLHEISESDAEAEGVDQWCDGGYDIANGYRISFCALWDSLNGKKHPWENNDRVWCLTFKQI